MRLRAFAGSRARRRTAGFWKQVLNLDLERHAWAALMQSMGTHLDCKGANCPDLTPALIARIHGVTPHRNDSSHKPKNAKELIKRDRELRTRFEAAVDLLADLIT